MDEALAHLTREWLIKALHDLQTAGITAKGHPFEKTHDIRRLVKQAAGVLPDFNRFTGAAEVLTPYVSAYRYPGLTDDAMPSREEFDEARQHAQTVYDFVLHLLPAEARP